MNFLFLLFLNFVFHAVESCHVYSFNPLSRNLDVDYSKCVNDREGVVSQTLYRNGVPIKNNGKGFYFEENISKEDEQDINFSIEISFSNGETNILNLDEFDFSFPFQSMNDFLDHVQNTSFSFFWDVPDPSTGLCQDKISQKTCAISSTGFGLASIAFAAERQFLPYDKLEERAYTILSTLNSNKTVKKFGFLYHYLDPDGFPSKSGYEVMVSSIDSTLLFCGAIVAGEYFGGRVKEEMNKMLNDIDWLSFSFLQDKVVSMGWQPENNDPTSSKGKLIDARWNYYTDELILITFLGIGSDDDSKRLPSGEWFYTWARNSGHYTPSTPGYNATKDFVYSLPGPLFTYQFAHLFIDFTNLGKDMPQTYHKTIVPAVDWHANSIEATIASRLYSIDQSNQYKGYSTKSWGPTACATQEGYCVGEFLPNGAGKGNDCNGAISPYGAISSIFLTPEISMEALLYYYNLKDSKGNQLVWKEKSEGGIGFFDSFNLDTMYVENDVLGIDQGPLIIALENYRSGFVQKYFMKNSIVQNALKRIGFENY